MISIELLTDKTLKSYDAFLRNNNVGTIYHGTKYKKFLEIVTGGEPYYFLAKNKDVVGVLPCFMFRSEQYGNLINSLPFYGSYGSPIVLNEDEDSSKNVKKELIVAYEDFAYANNVTASTIIISPYDIDNDFYDKNISYTYKDNRIGQISDISVFCDGEKIEDALFSKCHKHHRRAINKSKRSNFNYYHTPDLWAMKSLYKQHVTGMERIGGEVKPWKVFRTIRDIFVYGEDYRVYVAECDGEVAATLLLLYFNDQVEYFTPTFYDKYRTGQPLSGLIYHAMIEASMRGYKRWNWGGTWESQETIYRFKSRWGASDYPYTYYTQLYKKEILQESKSELLKEYKFFYVLPFSELLS